MWQDFFSIDWDSVEGWTQSQREALVDAMVWMMYADRHLADVEASAIRQEAEDVSWAGPMPIGDYVLASISQLRQVLGDAAKEEAYLKDVVDRLETEKARRQAVESCRHVALSDLEEDGGEHAFMKRLRAAVEGAG